MSLKTLTPTKNYTTILLFSIELNFHSFQISLKFRAFINRLNFYTDSNPPSGINGLSNIGAMCDPDACLILSDSYIMTNWVAAHELGHT